MSRGTAARWAVVVGVGSIAAGLLWTTRARASSQKLQQDDFLLPVPPGEEPPEELPPFEPPSPPRPLPLAEPVPLPAALIDPMDVEAGARMLASENPRGSRQLHIEQLWTQIRSTKPGRSLFDRITAGSGWGQQGWKKPPGLARPVSTARKANDAQRELTRAVLEGREPSILPGARRFWEPAQQDKSFAIAELARAKKAQGLELTEQEKRLIGYKRNADGVRAKWRTKDRLRLVGTIEGIEFWT